MAYWDSSALIKLYIKEGDSDRFEVFAAAEPLTTSALALFEMHTVFRRCEAVGKITSGGARALSSRLTQDAADGRVRVLSKTMDLARRFQEVLDACFTQGPLLLVRTADALPIAAALAAGETRFVTADVRQRGAANISGLVLIS